MSYTVEFYEGRTKLATGTADESNRITDIKPVEGRGLTYMRRLQVTVASGRHIGQTITAQVMAEDGDSVELLEAMPFK